MQGDGGCSGNYHSPSSKETKSFVNFLLPPQLSSLLNREGHRLPAILLAPSLSGKKFWNSGMVAFKIWLISKFSLSNGHLDLRERGLNFFQGSEQPVFLYLPLFHAHAHIHSHT